MVVPLSRLLGQRKVRDSIAAALAGGCVEDAAGAPLLGTQAAGERHAIVLAGELLGWVVCDTGGAAAAQLLSLLAASEADKRDLAREGVQKYKELALLYDVAEKIGACLRVEDTAQLVLEEVARTIRRGRAHIVLLDAANEGCDAWVAEAGAVPSRQLQTLLRPLVEQGRDEIVNAIGEDPRFTDLMPTASSLMIAPLRTKTGTLGALLVLCDSPAEYRSDELRLLSALATLCASSIEKARLYDKIARETRLRTNFQRYLSPGLVDDIIANGAELGLGGKSVECSVLFSDLCGFTSLTEQRSAGEIIDFLNEYFTVMSEIVLRHGGTLDKFIGDAIMAVFGAPCELPDAHGAAVQVALEMHQAMVRLQWKWAAAGWPAVRHRIGINTGTVIAGNIGSELRMDYTVVGDAVNVAARLEALSPPMETTISHETHSRIRERLVTRPQPPVHVKGKSQPAWPHQVVAVAAREPACWGVALPVTWRSASPVREYPGLLAALHQDQLTLHSPAEVPRDRELSLRVLPRADGAASPALRARLVAQDAREDAAGNRYWCARLNCDASELPAPLRRIRDATRPSAIPSEP